MVEVGWLRGAPRTSARRKWTMDRTTKTYNLILTNLCCYYSLFETSSLAQADDIFNNRTDYTINLFVYRHAVSIEDNQIRGEVNGWKNSLIIPHMHVQ